MRGWGLGERFWDGEWWECWVWGVWLLEGGLCGGWGGKVGQWCFCVWSKHGNEGVQMYASLLNVDFRKDGEVMLAGRRGI